jgi:hypothetical protein
VIGLRLVIAHYGHPLTVQVTHSAAYKQLLASQASAHPKKRRARHASMQVLVCHLLAVLNLQCLSRVHRFEIF